MRSDLLDLALGLWLNCWGLSLRIHARSEYSWVSSVELRSSCPRVCKTIWILFLTTVARANSKSNRVFVPHARCRILFYISRLGRFWYNTESLSSDGRTVGIWSIRLSETILKWFHDAFTDVLGNEATTIGNDVGVSARPIPEILKGSGILATTWTFELVSLIDIQGCCIFCGLVARPRWSVWHIFDADETSVPMQDVGVTALAITPVCRVLDVFCSRERRRHVVNHPCCLSKEKVSTNEKINE